MAYPALVSARRMHYDIDGCVLGYNINGGFGAGLANVLSGADIFDLNGETPTIDLRVVAVGNSQTLYFYILFPELIDLDHIMLRDTWSSSGGPSVTLGNLQSSADTTNGADGTWSTMATGGGTLLYTEDYSGGAVDPDWWRAVSPRVVSTNNTGIKAVRFTITFGGANNAGLRSLYLWGAKHSGETVDDITFLESDGATEWPNDDDFGDNAAGGASNTHTCYVKNVSPTKTANGITVKCSGTDSAQWQVSLDNVTFGSSKAIASLAAGATHILYWKFIPPAAAGGNYRPYASYLEADVTSWT